MSEKTTLLQGEVENLEVRGFLIFRLFRKNILSCINSRTERKIEDLQLKFKRILPVPTIAAIKYMALMFPSTCT